jgi:hypothetical protein
MTQHDEIIDLLLDRLLTKHMRKELIQVQYSNCIHTDVSTRDCVSLYCSSNTYWYIGVAYWTRARVLGHYLCGVHIVCVISGFRRRVNEIFFLLGC